MRVSKQEVNVQLLLLQCEEMAKQDKLNWRLEKYVAALDEMIASLQKLPNNKPNKDTISDYVRRTVFLKGVLETEKLANPAEKVVAAQLLSHGTATASETITKEIHQKTTTKCNKELREQLFQTGSDTNLRQRKENSSGTDMDELMKLHQSVQEKLADDMLILARNLKHQSQLAGSIINKDKEMVNKSSFQADKNLGTLKKESDRLQEHSRKAWKCWIFVMIVVVIVIFINLVLFMRIMKKK